MPPGGPAKRKMSNLVLDTLGDGSVGSSVGKCDGGNGRAEFVEPMKELGGSADVPPQHDLIKEAKARMKPLVASNFDGLNGACDYFYLLERDNERIKAKATGINVNMDSELVALPSASHP